MYPRKVHPELLILILLLKMNHLPIPQLQRDGNTSHFSVHIIIHSARKFDAGEDVVFAEEEVLGAVVKAGEGQSAEAGEKLAVLDGDFEIDIAWIVIGTDDVVEVSGAGISFEPSGA